MRKLYLVHPIGKLQQRTFAWVDGKQTWERVGSGASTGSGDYVLTVDDTEYVLPSTSVAHESRPVTKAAAKKAG